MFQKKELLLIAGSTLILGIVFGFDDGKTTFVLADWITNFVIVTIMAGMSILIHELAHKLVARRKDVTIEYTFWKFNRFTTKRRLQHGIPIGIIAALLATFFTNGTFYYTGIGSNTIIVDEKKRIGRKFTQLTNYEEALILLSGPVANVIFVLILNFIDKLTLLDLSNFVTINLVLAAWSMLPLPGLDGARIFFGSKNVYFFGLSLLIITFLLRNLNLFLSIGLSLLTAFTILILYYYKYE